MLIHLEEVYDRDIIRILLRGENQQDLNAMRLTKGMPNLSVFLEMSKPKRVVLLQFLECYQEFTWV